MAVLEIITVLGFTEQFFGVLQKLIKDRQKRKQFLEATMHTVCEAFNTEAEARFVFEQVLAREEIARLLIKPATSEQKQKLLGFFEAEVNQAGLALWQDFAPKAEIFINRTVELQLEIFGTIGDSASTDILGRKIDGLQKTIEELSKPSSTREEYLAQVIEKSRQNCIARWEAAGLSYELARELADDTSIGAPNDDLRSRFEKTTIWFVGEFGLGKSLLMERIFQEAVIDAFRDEVVPIPIFLRARDIASESLRLEEIVRTRAASLNLEKTQRVLVFVDGVDEASRNFAENLKIDVRTLQTLRPETRVFIAGRTLPNTQLSKHEQSIVLPKLGEAERLALMSRVSVQEVGRYHFYSSPAALRDAIEVPLFAILMANYLRERDFRSVLSTGELIHSLVEQSLERASAEIEGGFERLKSLALLTVERDGAINSGEIGSWSEVQALLKTRLVLERDGAIEFPYPILGQWFAAQGLTSEDFPIQRLLDDIYLLEQWRYPLVIFVATNPFEAVQKVLGPIIEQQPAFASSIISESLTQRVGTLPRAYEAGHKLREAMQVWINGLGPLSSLIAPVSDDGTVRPIRVATNEGLLSYSWYAGKEAVAEIQVMHNYGGWNAQPGLLSRDWPKISNLQEGK